MYYKLIEYFSRYTKERMGLILGVNSMVDIFNEQYYRHLNGGILEAFGILFTRDLKIYLYPYQPSQDEEMATSESVDINHRLKPLYDYLKQNKRMKDIEDYDRDILNIFSRDVLQMIKDGKEGWEVLVPGYVDSIIKEKKLFGYKPKPEKKALKS